MISTMFVMFNYLYVEIDGETICFTCLCVHVCVCVCVSL